MNEIVIVKPVLFLVLKGPYYNLIESGEKLEEYRDLKPYWARVFGDGKTIRIGNMKYKPQDVVLCFVHGYQKDRRFMYFECDGLRVDNSKPEWCGGVTKCCYVLSIGKKITKSQNL